MGYGKGFHRFIFRKSTETTRKLSFLAESSLPNKQSPTSRFLTDGAIARHRLAASNTATATAELVRSALVLLSSVAKRRFQLPLALSEESIESERVCLFLFMRMKV